MFRESTSNPARVSEEAFIRATGKPLIHWFRLLEAEKNLLQSERSLIHFLSTKYDLSNAWASMISSEFVLREPEVSLIAGEFETSATKTFPVGLHVLEDHFQDDDLRKSWLNVNLIPVKSSIGRSIRFEGLESGVLMVTFNGKGPQKCQVTLQHLKLADEFTAGKMKEFWKEQLQLLAKALQVHG